MNSMVAIPFFVIVLVTSLAAAQPQGGAAISYQIRGVVLEAETTQPVPGAQIQFFTQTEGPVKINGGWQLDESRKAVTDASGAFRFDLNKPGPYRVQAKKDGYTSSENRGNAGYAEVTLTSQKPAAEPRLFLSHPGQISGTVVAEETGKPIAHFRVRALPKRGAMGFIRVGGAQAETDAEGTFTATGLEPGEYAVEVAPQEKQEARVLTAFTDKDAETVDRDYEYSLWPGGHGQASAVPVLIGSGSAVNIGKLEVKKVPYYRVHLRIPSSSCQAGDTMGIGEIVIEGTSQLHRGLPPAPCGKDVLVTGFPPGTYRLNLAITGRTLATGGTASVPFSISDRNLVLTAPLSPPLSVDGVFVAADEAKLPALDQVTVSLRGIDGSGSLDEERPTPDASGKFHFQAVRPLDADIFVSGLPRGYYVQEIRYNSILLEGARVPIERPATDRLLKIVVDDKPAAITGAVSKDGKPVAQARVIAVRWPFELGTNVRQVTARTDDAGGFQMPGIPPGEYRVVAIDSALLDRAGPGDVSNAALERLLASGKKLELSRGAFANVSLELSEVQLGR